MEIRAVATWNQMASVGGVQTFLLDLLKHLPRSGIDMRVMDFEPVSGSLAGQLDAHRHQIHAVPRSSWDSSADHRQRAWGIMRVLQPQVVILNEWIGHELIPSIPRGIPVVQICHVDLPEDYYYERTTEYLDQLSSVVGVSPQIAARLRAHLPAAMRDRVRCICCGTELPDLADSDSVRLDNTPWSGQLRLLFYGRIVHRQKRVRDLPPLLMELRRRGVPMIVTIIGEGPDEPWLRTNLSAGVNEGWIRMFGPLPHDQAMREVQGQDVYILLSDFEGLPLTLLEAMARAVAPVVTDISSALLDRIEHGQQGLRFPVGQPLRAAAYIAELASHPQRLREMKSNAWTLAQEFSARAMRRAYVELISQIAAPTDLAHVLWRDAQYISPQFPPHRHVMDRLPNVTLVPLHLGMRCLRAPVWAGRKIAAWTRPNVRDAQACEKQESKLTANS